MSLVNKKILIVDDEELIREIFADYFEYLGAFVTQAKSGNEALAFLKKQSFDVLISDVRMNNGDGIFLVNAINQMPNCRPKMFFCSGYNVISEENAKKMGVIEVFPKPFSITHIFRTVSDSLTEFSELSGI